MSSYIVRVELHEEHDYTRFHEAMARRGFGRTITGDTGTVYDLPHATYSIDSAKSIEAIRAGVGNAALEVGRGAAVFVVEAHQKAWIGLTKHQPTLAELLLRHWG